MSNKYGIYENSKQKHGADEPLSPREELLGTLVVLLVLLFALLLRSL